MLLGDLYWPLPHPLLHSVIFLRNMGQIPRPASFSLPLSFVHAPTLKNIIGFRFFISLFLILAALGLRGRARDFLYLWRMWASPEAHGLSCPVTHGSQGSQLHPQGWKADS